MSKVWVKGSRLQLLCVLLTFYMLLMLPSCTTTLISDYDQNTVEQMELIAKKIDRLYIELGYIPAQERAFDYVESEYLDIEVELQALKTRQQLRPLNELTLKQVDISLSLFLQDRERHKKLDTISDFLIKRYRKQYNRLFIAMIRGEEIKKQPDN